MTELRVAPDKRDHALGLPTARLTLVEYGDYQCSFCAEANFELRRLLGTLRSEVRFVFRNFPLLQLHELALLAAMAAEAAGLQDRFWEMHDLLFESQQRLSRTSIVALAQALDLDVEKFQADLKNERLMQRIRDEHVGGIRSGVTGTPTFFLDGTRYEGSLDAAAFRRRLARIGPAASAYL